MVRGLSLSKSLVFLSQLRKKDRDLSKGAILVGNYETTPASAGCPSPRPSTQLLQLLAQSRDLWPESASTAIYEYRFLTDEQITALYGGPFKRLSRTGSERSKAPANLRVY